MYFCACNIKDVQNYLNLLGPLLIPCAFFNALGEPEALLNPKKKVFERVKPDLRVDGNGIATYKGCPWRLKGDTKAVIRAPTVADAQIS